MSTLQVPGITGTRLATVKNTGPNFTTTSTTFVDITGMTTGTIQVPGPIRIRWSFGSLNNNTANGGLTIAIAEDGTPIDQAGGLVNLASAAFIAERTFEHTSVTPGSHTYTLQVRAIFSGTVTVTMNDGTGTNTGPGLLVVEVI